MILLYIAIVLQFWGMCIAFVKAWHNYIMYRRALQTSEHWRRTAWDIADSLQLPRPDQPNSL